MQRSSIPVISRYFPYYSRAMVPFFQAPQSESEIPLSSKEEEVIYKCGNYFQAI